MNIVFWSPLAGHGATTSNMACLSIMSSLLYHYKTVAFQSVYSNNYLDQSFLGNKKSSTNLIKEEYTGYGQKGIDGVIDSIFMNSYVNEDLTDYCVEVLKDVNYYIPSTVRSNETVFIDKMTRSIPTLLEECEKKFDITFIDHQSKYDNIEKEIFKYADLCVVNLSQNPELISYSKEQIEKMNCSSKVFYVIGRYDASNRYTKKSIIKRLNIPSSDIGVIPYNSEFMEAVLCGKIKNFLLDNLFCTKKDFNYIFMQEVESVTDKLLVKAGLMNA